MCRRVTFWLIGVFLAGLAPAAHAEGVVVLKSGNLGPYDRFVTGFAVEFGAPAGTYVLGDDEDEAVVAEIQAARPDLVVALGPKAAGLAARRLGGVPVVFALVPNWQRYGLSGSHVAGIALQRAVKSDLSTLKAVVPRVKRVGVFFDPRYSSNVVEEARRAAGELGLEIVAVQIRRPTEIARAARRVADKVDALWMVPDRTVADVRAFQALRDLALGRGLPLMALTGSQVREGALFALAPNYTELGRQAARLARRILGGARPGSLGVQEPAGLDLVFNLTAAARVGAKAGGGEAIGWALLEHAAKSGFTVRVYE